MMRRNDFARCPKCDRYDWADSHRCFEFRVHYPDYHGDDETEAVTVWAAGVEAAVERWIMQHEVDCCEYPVASGRETLTVRARKTGGEWANYTVSGETVPSYIVEPAK